MWVVNLKKSIASQLQLDVTGVRPNGDVANWSAPKDGENTLFTVYEVWWYKYKARALMQKINYSFT